MHHNSRHAVLLCQYNQCDLNQISEEAVRSRRHPGQSFPAQVLVMAPQLPFDVPRSFTVPLLLYIQR